MGLKRFILTSLAVFEMGVATEVIAQTHTIIPEPRDFSVGSAPFELNDRTVIAANRFAKEEAGQFALWLGKACGTQFQVVDLDALPAENFIVFSCTKRVEDLTPERLKVMPDSLAKRVLESDKSAYKLNVSRRGVLLNAEYNEGVFYGMQSLRQLFPSSAESGGLQLPLVMKGILINDRARFQHRGLLLDCCRHFMSVDFIKSYIDLLAYYKMNVLHWHLTEDQGWRIQIDKYPLLTEVGAWRTEKDGSRYGGFYSKEQIREVVEYASKRYVTIIPEIELPGHSTAAIAAYPALSCTGETIAVENEWGVFKDIYCAGNEYTFEFLENVLSEVCELFPGKYIHIGGDEAPKFRWEHCERCQKRLKEKGLKNEAELQTYFIERIAAFLATKGKRIIGWDEILEGGIPADAAIQSWRGMEGGKAAAMQHHAVVMSPTSHCYFDYGLASTDLQKVYLFDPIPEGLSAADAGWIKGGECNMWTEHAPQEKVDAKVFPRLLALSEVLWTYPEQRNYEAFYARVTDHLPRLRAQDVQFGFPRIPVEPSITPAPFGAMQVELVSLLPNTIIRYQLSETSAKAAANDFRAYEKPLLLKEPATLTVEAVFMDMPYSDPLQWSFEPHAGFNQPLELTYEPSPYYTGGGNMALADGRVGSSNFRDGVWQAVQGKNMEAVVDLGEIQRIDELETHWFMYGNAWIFLPAQVEYLISDDGVQWKSAGVVSTKTDEQAPGEFYEGFRLKRVGKSARFVKMTAVNHGPCPSWHDAPGEPSWLFCDELIVRTQD
jgi:hexosaminidase